MPLPRHRSSAKPLALAYAALLLYASLFPFVGWRWPPGQDLATLLILPATRWHQGFELTSNLLGYLPLGGHSDTGLTDRRAGRLAIRAEAGAVLAKEGIALPSTQLFLAGGDTSVRGYSYHDLGVLQPDGQITAGRYLSTGSLEWQRPISRNGRLTDWESTLFIDAGAVADQPSELRAKVGVGIGARWRSPVGPLQIDLAYGVDVQRFRLHLNVGFTF